MESIIVTMVVPLCFFPGFLILKIVEAMTDTRRRTHLDKIVVAVRYSVWIYFLYLMISHWSKLRVLPVQYVKGPAPAIGMAIRKPKNGGIRIGRLPLLDIL